MNLDELYPSSIFSKTPLGTYSQSVRIMAMSVFIPLILYAAANHGTAIMVHGAGGGGWEYEYWAKEFRAKGWKVVARDLVPSAKGLGKTTFEDYLGQIEAWGKNAKRPLVLVGASMGGALALKASKKLKPDSLILINSVLPKGITKPEQTKPYPPIIKWANGPLKDTEDAMPDSDRKTILWAWKKWRDESGGVLNELKKGILTVKPRCPILVMISEKDTDIPPAGSEKLAEYLKADKIRLPNTSHVGPLMGKRAKETANLALDWIHLKLMLK